jgi:hypothetical protein
MIQNPAADELSGFKNQTPPGTGLAVTPENILISATAALRKSSSDGRLGHCRGVSSRQRGVRRYTRRELLFVLVLLLLLLGEASVCPPDGPHVTRAPDRRYGESIAHTGTLASSRGSEVPDTLGGHARTLSSSVSTWGRRRVMWYMSVTQQHTRCTLDFALHTHTHTYSTRIGTEGLFSPESSSRTWLIRGMPTSCGLRVTCTCTWYKIIKSEREVRPL